MFRSGPNFCWRYSSEGHGNWYCGGSTIFTNNDYVPRVRWHLTYTSVVNIWIDKQISAFMLLREGNEKFASKNYNSFKGLLLTTVI
jgi:hypothetical protein